MKQVFQVIQRFDRDEEEVLSEEESRDAALKTIERACNDACDLLCKVEFYIKEVFIP